MREARYRTFISYSHLDDKWATWLHRALEAYKPPKHLVGRQLILAFTVFDRNLHAGAYKLYRIPADLDVPELQTRPAGSDPDWTP